MTLTSESAARIDEYIGAHPNCNTGMVRKQEVAGRLEDLSVYRLPTSLLFYNIKNGRFAAEYMELKKRHGGELDPTRRNDAEEIQKMLVKEKGATKILKEDLLKVGQREPGIITYDGYVINGNRRMAAMTELSNETSEEKWRYIEVLRLPFGTDERTLWKIEAGEQFSRGERLDYNKINVLLKFREGRQVGLTPAEIAASLYGGYSPDEITDALKRLELIDSYLEYIGAPNIYAKVEDKHEHFVELQKFIDQQGRRGQNKSDLLKATQCAFELIKAQYPHRKLRDLGRIMNNAVARDNFFKAALGTMQQQVPEITQAFEDSVDIVQAAEEKTKPTVLLKRALTNLDSVDTSLIKGNEPELNDLIQKLTGAIEKIKRGLSAA
jgi:hypothetical protein